MAELLIALAILGAIATFTIPKVLQSQADGKYNSIAKESISMVSAAYQEWARTKPNYSTTGGMDLIPYLNYVSYDTSSTIDNVYTMNTYTCNSADPCLTLHNGAKLKFWGTFWGGNTSTDAVQFMIDPDGKVTDGTTNGPGKSLSFYVFANGRVLTRSDVATNGRVGGGALTPWDSNPPWFSWD